LTKNNKTFQFGYTLSNLNIPSNWKTHIRHLCRKTTVLSCHICLINTGIERSLDMDVNFDQQMSLSKKKCWFSNNCLCYSKL